MQLKYTSVVKTICLFIILSAAAFNPALAQVKFNTAINRQIDANYSGHYAEVDVTFDGGYVAVSGGSSFSVTKFSTNGAVIWSRDVSWGSGIYYARNITQLADSGYAITGTGGGSFEIGMMRLDKDGNVLWVKSYNGSVAKGNWVAQTLDGGLIFGGQIGPQGILFKTDINGALQWSKTYSQLAQVNAGFINADSSFTIWGLYDNNNFYVARAEIDKNGNPVTAQRYNISFFTQYLSVKRTRDKGFIVLMDEYGTSPVIMKTDSAGAIQWKNKYVFANDPNKSRDPRSIEETDFGYVFTGENFINPAPAPPNLAGCSTAFWAKIDNSGIIMWVREYDTYCWDVAYSVKQAPDKGLIIWTSMFTNGNGIQSDLIKADSSGHSVCTIYNDTAATTSIGITPAALTVTATAANALVDRTNTYSGGAVVASFPCPMLPTAAFVADKLSVCPGTNVNFTDQSGGAPTSWKWTFTGGTPNSSTSQNPSVVYNTNGVYSVKLVVTNTNGADSLSKTNYITVAPQSSVGTITAPTDTICAETGIDLTLTGATGGFQWQSSVDGIAFTNVPGDTAALYSTGNISQTAYYRVVPTQTCSDTSGIFKLTVNPNPTPVVSAPDSIICSSDSARINSSGPYVSYLWNNGDTRDHTYVKQPQGYWVSVTDVNGCVGESNHQSISVLPISSISLVVQGDTLASFNGTAYQWFKDGDTIPGANAAVYIAEASGGYAVEIIDTNGCNALSNTVPITIIGINEMNTNSAFNIYPNPFIDIIYLNTNALNTSVKEMRIFDVSGRTISTNAFKKLSLSLYSLETTSLPAGIYYIKVKAGDKEYVQKVVKIY